jgi:Zn-dependent protease with chaperone function
VAAVVAVAQATLLVGVLWAFTWVGLEFARVTTGAIRYVAVVPALLLLWSVYRTALVPEGITYRWPIEVQGFAIDPDREPRLVAEVADVARIVGAPAPDRIIASFDPRFFVVATRTAAFDGTADDLVLHIPLASMRLLTRDEFRSALGHELAHFVPAEAAFSHRIAPMRLHGTRFPRVRRFAEDPLSVPAAALLRLALGPIAPSLSPMLLDRELDADRRGAVAGSPRALGSAMAKLARTEAATPAALTAFRLAVARGEAPPSLGDLVDQHARAPSGGAARRDPAVGHPLDDLPGNAARLRALGIEPGDPFAADLDPRDPALRLLTDPGEISRRIEARLAVATPA